MALTITDRAMISPATVHTASPVTDDQYGDWRVSWLPGRNLTRNQAITAMTIAEIAARVPTFTEADGLATDYMAKWWPHIDGWAAELGLSGPQAVAMASESRA